MALTAPHKIRMRFELVGVPCALVIGHACIEGTTRCGLCGARQHPHLHRDTPAYVLTFEHIEYGLFPNPPKFVVWGQRVYERGRERRDDSDAGLLTIAYRPVGAVSLADHAFFWPSLVLTESELVRGERGGGEGSDKR